MVLGVIPFQVQDLPFPIVEFNAIFIYLFSFLAVKVPLNGSMIISCQPFFVVYHLQTCWGCTFLWSRWLMKMLHSIGASIDLWGCTISDWHPPGLHPLITTLWTWQFSQISIYLTLNVSTHSSVYLWECFDTCCQKHHKSQQIPQLFLHPLN